MLIELSPLFVLQPDSNIHLLKHSPTHKVAEYKAVIKSNSLAHCACSALNILNWKNRYLFWWKWFPMCLKSVFSDSSYLPPPQLLQLWEKNGYFDEETIQQLQNPALGLGQYQVSGKNASVFCFCVAISCHQRFPFRCMSIKKQFISTWMNILTKCIMNKSRIQWLKFTGMWNLLNVAVVITQLTAVMCVTSIVMDMRGC